MTDARVIDAINQDHTLGDRCTSYHLRSSAARQPSRHFSLEIKEVTEPHPAWDSFVADHPGGDIVQSSLWALSKRCLGQTSVTIISYDENGRVTGGLMLLEQRIKRVLRVGIVSKGPLVRDNDRMLLSILTEALQKLVWRRGLFALILQPPEGGDEFEQQLEDFGFQRGALSVGTEATARVNLLRTEEDILAGLSPSARRNIRKGLSKSIIVEQINDVAAFHKLYTASAERKGFRPVSLRYLETQWEMLSQGKHVAIMAAKYEDRISAAIWLTVFGGTVTYKFPGWDQSIPSPRFTNEVLHWQTMRWAKMNGARSYDFGGFNRQAAENIANGLPLPPDFNSTPSLFKYGFDQKPTIFPKAQFLIGNSFISRAVAPLVRAALDSDITKRVAQKLRG